MIRYVVSAKIANFNLWGSHMLLGMMEQVLKYQKLLYGVDPCSAMYLNRATPKNANYSERMSNLWYPAIVASAASRRLIGAQIAGRSSVTIALQSINVKKPKQRLLKLISRRISYANQGARRLKSNYYSLLDKPLVLCDNRIMTGGTRV